ncbi:MAG: hypothetical protein V3V00_12505, partial [Saprospiraceae bacterium]
MKIKPLSIVYQIIFIATLAIFYSCSVSYLVGEDEKSTSSNSAINISYAKGHYSDPLDGRLILLISNNIDTELRFQLRDDSKTCQGFGMDLNKWKAGEKIPFAMNAFGYPIRDMKNLPSGEYYVQVVFHKYET